MVYGDVIGSYYELHPTQDYHFPLQPQSTFTDDTVLTVAVCDTLLANPQPVGPLGVRRRGEGIRCPVPAVLPPLS